MLDKSTQFEYVNNNTEILNTQSNANIKENIKFRINCYKIF